MITNRIIKLYIPLIAIIISFLPNSGCQSSSKNIKNIQSEKNHIDIPLRGLYIPNRQSRNLGFIKKLVQRGKPMGINMLLIDVHTSGSRKPKINRQVTDYLKKQNIYIAARIVCFQDGLNRLPVSEKKIEAIVHLVKNSVQAGFDEIQLDYIRFKDGGIGYPLKKKYSFIEGLLREFKKITDEYRVTLSADIFGRIVYNKNDTIGQKLELFARHTKVIYPMLYPSHFTGDKYRMANPGETVREGIQKGLDRLKGMDVHIHAFIQAFPYNIGWARVPLSKYIELQIVATEETKARGWVAWNAYGDYNAVIKALNNIKDNKTDIASMKSNISQEL